MKRLIVRITDWWWIIKNDKKSLEMISSKYRAESFLRNTSRLAETYRKNGRFRKALTWHFKDIRKKFPYEVKDYLEAKKMYEDYFLMGGNLISFNKFKSTLLKQKIRNTGEQECDRENILIYCFRDEVPVKGKKSQEFYINGSFNKGLTLEVKIENNEIKSRAWNESAWKRTSLSYDQENITQYLYATQDQIKSFYAKRTQYQHLQSVREIVLAELRKIDQEIYAIDDLHDND